MKVRSDANFRSGVQTKSKNCIGTTPSLIKVIIKNLSESETI